MLFPSLYVRIVDDLEKTYQTNNDFVKYRELKKGRWKDDAKSRHLVTILKILAEHGPCTISEIVDNDGSSKIKDRIRDRQNIYSRVIKGNRDSKTVGLISKRLVIEDGQVMKSKPTKRYKLSLFGILYAIRIFTPGSPKIAKNVKYQSQIEIVQDKNSESFVYKDSILEELAKNYSEDLPLIFGKWEFLKTNFGSLVNLLWDMSIISKDNLAGVTANPIINNRPFTVVNGLDDVPNRFATDITIWFYGILTHNDPDNKLGELLKKDKEIFDWYSSYISKLLKCKNEEIWRIQFVAHSLKGEFKKQDKVLDKLLRFQGLKKDDSGKVILVKN